MTLCILMGITELRSSGLSGRKGESSSPAHLNIRTLIGTRIDTPTNWQFYDQY